MVLASDLTLVECDRAFIRAHDAGRLTRAQAGALHAALARSAGRWSLLRVDAHVIERARRPFPHEPLRALDALHLASALIARDVLPDLALLSLDRRIRAAGRELGLPLAP